MLYKSTRGAEQGVSSAQAIKAGLAKDGGLFIPESLPAFEMEKISDLIGKSYFEICEVILKEFLTDYSEEALKACISGAYSNGKFDHEDIAPVVRLNDNINILELWHGPTCAFKDMALQLLPHLLVNALKITDEKNKIAILVATSGDTGKAALEGFKDIEGTSVTVFFPNNGVSEVQRLQMVTQEGQNVEAIAVNGNFDDTQNGVKKIFGDVDFQSELLEKGIKLSSANSINWGRLVPQIVYYFFAYVKMIENGEITEGEAINIVVPTGNFGNILAAWYAMNMGLPVSKLICASNDNNILTDFIKTGTYDIKREFVKTISPSMDILISSNLERLLFELTDHNTDLISDWMERLKRDGIYSVDIETKKKISKHFWGGYCNEEETMKTIECIYNDYNYVIDTHTAVAVDVYDKYVISTNDMTKTLIVSTASPFKFNDSVANAILGAEKIEDKNEFEILEILSKECNLKIPEGLKNLDKKNILHSKVCEKNEMLEQVREVLK